MPETTAGTFQFFIGNVVLDVFWVFHGEVQRVAKNHINEVANATKERFFYNISQSLILIVPVATVKVLIIGASINTL